MQDLCPLCSKNGLKNKIKLLQINLQEAIWMCEEEKCVWPFGYEDFVFYPRTVGKVWSCYWNDYKPTTSRLKENLVTPNTPKLPLCFTPVISTKHIPEEVINNSDMHLLENINATNSSSNITNTDVSFDDLHNSGFGEPSMISNINIEEYNENILNNETTVSNTNVHNNNLQSINGNIEGIKVENKWIDLLNEDIEEKNDISIENVKSMDTVKKVPKITSIEKTNIIISNMKIGNQIPNVKLRNEESVHQKLKKEILDVESVGVTGTKLKQEIEELSNLEPSENNENILKPNVNITMMEIDGLPPITLSFEIPVCSTAPETVIANTQLGNCKSNNTKPNSLEVKDTFVKRNISSGKIYEKFNFSAIKKKLELNNSSNTNNNKDNSSNVETQVQKVENDSLEPISNASAICISNQLDKSYSSNMKIQVKKVKNDSPETISNLSATCIQNQLGKSVTCLSNQGIVESDTVAVNASVNIDTVLEELICNDYSVSENISDDWIKSLLI